MERHRRPGEEAAPRHRARLVVLSTPPLRTDRLDLEPVSPVHAEEMVGLLADRRLYAFFDDEASPSLDELRARYARQAAGVSPDGREVWHSWIVRERASGRAIGLVQATVGATAGPPAVSDDTTGPPPAGDATTGTPAADGDTTGPPAADGDTTGTPPADGDTTGTPPAGVDPADPPYDGIRSAELAWVIAVPWQGRGYATEAAAAVRDAVRGPASVTGDGVSRVHAYIAAGHTASEAVARRLGLAPSDVVRDGEVRWELPPAR